MCCRNLLLMRRPPVPQPLRSWQSADDLVGALVASGLRYAYDPTEGTYPDPGGWRPTGDVLRDRMDHMLTHPALRRPVEWAVQSMMVRDREPSSRQAGGGHATRVWLTVVGRDEAGDTAAFPVEMRRTWP